MKTFVLLAPILLLAISDGTHCKLACSGNEPLLGCKRGVSEPDVLLKRQVGTNVHEGTFMVKRQLGLNPASVDTMKIKRSLHDGFQSLNTGSRQKTEGKGREKEKIPGSPQSHSKKTVERSSIPVKATTGIDTASHNVHGAVNAEPDPDRRQQSPSRSNKHKF